MTALNQDEIVSNTRTVIQGLDTLKNDYQQILNSLLNSLNAIKKENGDTNLIEEKTNILQKSLETIELGLGEGQVRVLILLLFVCVGVCVESGLGERGYMRLHVCMNVCRN